MNKTNVTWNLNELRTLCEQLGRNVPEILFHTIEWKLFQIDYHAELAKELILKYMTIGHNSNDPSFKEDWMKATAQIVAFAHAFDTVADILLQIINCAYFDTPFPKNQVKADTVLRQLKTEKKHVKVLAAADDFFQAPEILYIRAFINTEKHAHLIDLQYHFEFSQENPDTYFDGFRIKAFSDGQQNYQEKPLNEIINEYPAILLEKTLLVGNSINEDLKYEIN
jgi:hypothetical protein